jgi:hypothetical protein
MFNSCQCYFLDERQQFDEQTKQMQSKYRELLADLSKYKQRTSITNDDVPSNRQRLEQYQQLLLRLNDTSHQTKEHAHVQRLLISKGHRIDVQVDGDINMNMKHLNEQIDHEIERIERNLQAEDDFHRLENEFESHLQISTEQLTSIAGQQQGNSIVYQVNAKRVFSSNINIFMLILYVAL